MTIEINNRTKGKIDSRLIKKIAGEFVRTYKIKRNQEISLAIVGDAAMKKLNQTYRGLNRPTDVLAFSPLNSAEGNLTGQAGDDGLWGEVVIDYTQIKRQAGRYGQTAREELIFVLTHGLLHLAGYDDETETERLEMIRLGKSL